MLWGRRLAIATTSRTAVGLALLAGTMALAGCGGRGTSPPQQPKLVPPGPETVAPRSHISIHASADDAETFEWKLEGAGKLSSDTGTTIDYTAPAAGGVIETVTVTARNAGGVSRPATLQVRVPELVTVRLDALAIPAGWMSGTGSPERYVALAPGRADCAQRPGCMRVTYRPGAQFAGIVWWPQRCGTSGTPDVWERVRTGECAVNVAQAGNLRQAQRLMFWAKGRQGNEQVEFKIGASDLWPRPGRSLGPVTLTQAWQPIEIDLAAIDMTNVTAPFIWVATDMGNPNGATFFLEGIQLEGIR